TTFGDVSSSSATCPCGCGRHTCLAEEVFDTEAEVTGQAARGPPCVRVIVAGVELLPRGEHPDRVVVNNQRRRLHRGGGVVYPLRAGVSGYRRSGAVEPEV